MKTTYHIETVEELRDIISPLPSDSASKIQSPLPAFRGKVKVVASNREEPVYTVDIVDDPNYIFSMPIRAFLSEVSKLAGINLT